MLSLKPQLKTGKEEVVLIRKFLFMMTPFPETQQWLLLFPLLEAIFHVLRKTTINLYSELCTLGVPCPLLDSPEQDRLWYTELYPVEATRWLEAGAGGRGEAERSLPSLERDGCQLLLLSTATGGREEGRGSQTLKRGAQQKAMNTTWNLENSTQLQSWTMSTVNEVWVRSPKVISKLHHSAMLKLEEQSTLFTPQSWWEIQSQGEE